MKRHHVLIIAVVLMAILIAGCNAPRNIAGSNPSEKGGIGVKGLDNLPPGYTVWYKSNCHGNSGAATDLLRQINVVGDTIRWEGNLPYGNVWFKFFIRDTYNSYELLDSLYVRNITTGETIDLSHRLLMQSTHTNGKPINWGNATEFVHYQGGFIDEMTPTPMTQISIQHTGLAEYTYNSSGQEVLIDPATALDYQENVPAGMAIWTQNSRQSLLLHRMTDGIMTGKIPSNGYFSLLIKQEDGVPLLMGIKVTTPYGIHEMKNVYDYYTGSGDNITHWLVFLGEMINGHMYDYEHIDTRFGSPWSIIINGTYQIRPDYIHTIPLPTNTELFQEER